MFDAVAVGAGVSWCERWPDWLVGWFQVDARLLDELGLFTASPASGSRVGGWDIFSVLCLNGPLPSMGLRQQPENRIHSLE